MIRTGREPSNWPMKSLELLFSLAMLSIIKIYEFDIYESAVSCQRELFTIEVLENLRKGKYENPHRVDKL